MSDTTTPVTPTRLRCHLEVVYHANLKPGMLVLGNVVPKAPTRPVQPIAHGLRVAAIHPSEQNGVSGFTIEWEGLTGHSTWYPLHPSDDRFMVLIEH